MVEGGERYRSSLTCFVLAVDAWPLPTLLGICGMWRMSGMSCPTGVGTRLEDCDFSWFGGIELLMPPWQVSAFCRDRFPIYWPRTCMCIWFLPRGPAGRPGRRAVLRSVKRVVGRPTSGGRSIGRACGRTAGSTNSARARANSRTAACDPRGVIADKSPAAYRAVPGYQFGAVHFRCGLGRTWAEFVSHRY